MGLGLEIDCIVTIDGKKEPMNEKMNMS